MFPELHGFSAVCLFSFAVGPQSGTAASREEGGGGGGEGRGHCKLRREQTSGQKKKKRRGAAVTGLERDSRPTEVGLTEGECERMGAAQAKQANVGAKRLPVWSVASSTDLVICFSATVSRWPRGGPPFYIS